MKRIFMITALIMLLASPALAQTNIRWINVEDGPPTLAWDPVTLNADGVPLPATEVVKYECFLANAITDPGKTNPAMITAAPIVATEFAVDLGGVEGKYFAGVRAIRTLNDDRLRDGDMSWSDNPEVVADGVPFGLKLYAKPALPGQLVITE